MAFEAAYLLFFAFLIKELFDLAGLIFSSSMYCIFNFGNVSCNFLSDQGLKRSRKDLRFQLNEMAPAIVPETISSLLL